MFFNDQTIEASLWFFPLQKLNGEYDEELLNLTGEVLAVNPDFYTLWNLRKETFLELKDAK